MTYARLCIHKELKPHYVTYYIKELRCPGGEFLADDALIIEKVDGEWPDWCHRGATKQFLDALTVREGAGETAWPWPTPDGYGEQVTRN